MSARRSSELGVNSTLREIGVALGTAVMTAIFVGAGGQLLPDSYVDAARPAVYVGAAVLVVAVVAALWLPAGRSARPTAETEPASAPAPASASERDELAVGA